MHLAINKKAGFGGVSGGSGGGSGGGVGGPWNLIFDEQFATTAAEGTMFAVNGDHAKGLGAYANTWGAQTYLTTFGSQQGTGDYYGINNISVVSGIAGATGNCMRFRLLHNDGTGKKVGANPYPNTSGTPGAGSAASAQLYGRYEYRFKADSVQGWKTAWLLWPGTWAWTNEVDFPEGNLNGHIGGNVHKNAPNQSQNAASYTTGTALYTSWNTGAIEWTPTGVKFFLNDMVNPVLSTATHPAEPMFDMLQSENLLPGGGTQPTADANVYVDYYRQWSWTG